MKARRHFGGMLTLLLSIGASDIQAQTLYWTDIGTEKIQRANLALGTSAQDLVTAGRVSAPVSIVLDRAAGKMYWTEASSADFLIGRANLDGTDVVYLVEGLIQPSGIALDPGAGKIYWTDIGARKVQRANYDGSNIEDLVTPGTASMPVEIVLDTINDKMYWTERSPADFMISRANLDGSNVEFLVTGLTSPSGVALAPPATGPQSGACCFGNGFCIVQTQEDCESVEGQLYLGDGTECVGDMTCPAVCFSCRCLDGSSDAAQSAVGCVAEESACADLCQAHGGVATFECDIGPCPAIPTMSEWALTITGLLILGAGALVLRRRGAAHGRSPTRMSTRLCTTVMFSLSLSTSSLAGTGAPEFIREWGTQGSGPGQFSGPHGIEVDAGGNVYVADTGNNRIQKFAADGTFIMAWGAFGTGPGQFNHPHGIGVGPLGNLYVAETGNNRVQRFTADGTFITTWGSFGTGDGQFQHNHGLAVDSNGNVFVADRDQNRVQKFTSDGTFLLAFGTTGTGDGQFTGTNGVAVDGDDNVFVGDSSPRIQKFTNNGGFIAAWGSAGTGDGQFDFPRGLSTDAFGNLYVADRNLHRIQKFTGQGEFLTKWGSFGSGEGEFNFPYAVRAATNGVVFVADSSNHRVQKFQLTSAVIPAVSRQGLLLMAVLVLLAGGVLLRRRGLTSAT